MAIKTPIGTLAFPVLASPKAPKNSNNPDNLLYSATLLFTEADTNTAEFKALQAEIASKCIEALGREKAALLMKGGKIKTGINYEVEASGFPAEYKCFMRMKSKNKPGLVDRFADPKTGKPIAIRNVDDLYAGCRARALVSLKYWEVDGGRAVTVYLNHLQKVAEGVRIDGRVAAEDAFDALEAAPELDIVSLSGNSNNGFGTSSQTDDDELAALLSGVN